MKRSIRSRLLRTTIAGLIVFSPAYALAGEAQYFFGKDDSAKSTDKTTSVPDQKSSDGKTSKRTGKKLAASTDANGIVAPTAANRGAFRPDFDGAGGRGPAMVPTEGKDQPGGSVSAQNSSSSRSRGGFRPDFDGAGGRGPAMAPVEGKKDDDSGYYIKTRGYRLEP